MTMTTSASHAPAHTVNRLVPFAHVTSVDASMAFYHHLGFVPVRVLKDNQGQAFWAMLASGGAELMLARASGPIDAEQQAVLFYMYSKDVATLRQHLIESGHPDRTSMSPEANAKGPFPAVLAISFPNHMPAGELRIHDPDGYVILVGQLG
ncbi:MAG: VOC family protein [Phycisphaerales bacterium]